MCDPVRGTNRSAALYIQKLLTAIGELWPVAVVCDQPGCYLGGIVCLRLWVGKANQKKPGFIVVPLCILLLLVTKSCPTLCSPMDCKACQLLCPWDFPGKILEWVAISFSNRSSWPRGQIHISSGVSCIAVRFLTAEPPDIPNSNCCMQINRKKKPEL